MQSAERKNVDPAGSPRIGPLLLPLLDQGDYKGSFCVLGLSLEYITGLEIIEETVTGSNFLIAHFT